MQTFIALLHSVNYLYVNRAMAQPSINHALAVRQMISHLSLEYYYRQVHG